MIRKCRDRFIIRKLLLPFIQISSEYECYSNLSCIDDCHIAKVQLRSMIIDMGYICYFSGVSLRSCIMLRDYS